MGVSKGLKEENMKADTLHDFQRERDTRFSSCLQYGDSWKVVVERVSQLFYHTKSSLMI